MSGKLIGEKIDWDKIAQKLQDGFDMVVKTAEAKRWDGEKMPYYEQAADISQALVRVSAEQRAVLKDQREREREQPKFDKPRA